jgi:D-glycero-D-manno-heptose 1,7-bisphosphate phosphatase
MSDPVSTPAGRQRIAAFLDRDGTLIEDAAYLSSPDGVVLLSGATEAVAALNAAGVLAVVVTNQSGIAQGLLTEVQYQATRERLDSLMNEHGARIDATYHCPHHPSVSGRCDCRKPATGMYRQAALDLDIDLTRSLYVGDRRRDAEPGLQLGGRGVLVPSIATPPDDIVWARTHAVLEHSLGDVVAGFLAGQRS